MWAARRGGAGGAPWGGVVGCVSLCSSQWTCVLSFSEKRALAIAIRIRANMGMVHYSASLLSSKLISLGEPGGVGVPGGREGGHSPPLGASGYPTRRGGRPPPTVAIDIIGNSAGSRSGGARPLGIISILFHRRFGFITVSPKTLSHYQHNAGRGSASLPYLHHHFWWLTKFWATR